MKRALSNIDTSNVIGFIGILVGGVLQKTTLPLWTEAIGPYFVLVWASFVFALVFYISERIMYCQTTSIPSMKRYWLTLLGIGVFDSLTGFFIVFSSPSNRTPPVLQVLLGNSKVIFTMPLTRLLVPGKRYYSYLHWKPIVALVLLFIGILIALIPDFNLLAEGKVEFLSSSHGLVYTLVFIVGDAWNAAYNVLQEKFITDREIESQQFGFKRHKNYDRTFVLFWGCLFQFITMVVLFPADAIPQFGVSKNIPSVWRNFGDAFMCNFGQGERCKMLTFLFGVLFTTGYIFSYVGTLLLNEKSANFAMFASTLTSPIAIVIMKMVPVLAVGVQQTPLWSVIPSAVVLFVGVSLWKNWEETKKRGPAVSQSLN